MPSVSPATLQRIVISRTSIRSQPITARPSPSPTNWACAPSEPTAISAGSLYVKTAQREQARAELSAAIELYRAMDMTFWLPQAEAVMVSLRGGVG
jgi:hypothetical protein